MTRRRRARSWGPRGRWKHRVYYAKAKTSILVRSCMLLGCPRSQQARRCCPGTRHRQLDIGFVFFSNPEKSSDEGMWRLVRIGPGASPAVFVLPSSSCDVVVGRDAALQRLAEAQAQQQEALQRQWQLGAPQPAAAAAAAAAARARAAALRHQAGRTRAAGRSYDDQTEKSSFLGASG